MAEQEVEVGVQLGAACGGELAVLLQRGGFGGGQRGGGCWLRRGVAEQVVDGAAEDGGELQQC